MNKNDYLPICENLVMFLNNKFTDWQFYGSVAENEDSVLLKIAYTTPEQSDNRSVSGVMYFNEGHSLKDVLEKIEFVNVSLNANRTNN